MAKQQYSAPKIETYTAHAEPILNANSIDNKYNEGNIDLAPTYKVVLDDENEEL